MTLKEYYDSLPPRVSPKTDFVKEICQKCGVAALTVRNWISGFYVPESQANREIISQVTGIPEDELFKRIQK